MAGLTEKTFVDLLFTERRDLFNRTQNRQIENFKDYLFTYFVLEGLRKLQTGDRREDGSITIDIPSIDVQGADGGGANQPSVNLARFPDFSNIGYLKEKGLYFKLLSVLLSKPYMKPLTANQLGALEGGDTAEKEDFSTTDIITRGGVIPCLDALEP